MSIRTSLTFAGLVIALLSARRAHAQGLVAPDMGCLQVLPAGQIVVNWVPVSDPGNTFVAYHLYRGNSPFNPVYVEEGVFNTLASSAFTHNTAAGLSTSYCYYVITESTDGINAYYSSPSDTVCSISLDVQPSVAPPGLAELDWNDPYPYDAPFTGGQYGIWLENPPGIWNKIDSVAYGINNWSLEITECQADYNFQVGLETNQGCVFLSDVEGDTFFDVTAPDIPVLTSVSVDHSTNDAVITWNSSLAPDTQGYLLYNCTNGTTVTLLDTIYGANQTQFVDLLAATTVGPVCYLLAAIDTCYSGNPPSPNTSPTSDVCNCSVFLSQISYAICEDFVHLNWTAYSGWIAGVDNYAIFHSFEGSTPELVGTVNGDLLTFTHFFSAIQSGVHSYYIEAQYGQGYKSRSNLRNVSIFYPTAPAIEYLSSASVTGPKEVTIRLQTAPTSTEHRFHLERKKFNDTNWEELIVLSNQTGTEMTFTDPNANPAVFAYSYRIIVENLCGAIVDTSNIGVPVLLEGLANTSRLVNLLQWTDYEGWENGIGSFRIYRKIGSDGADELITELNGTRNFYEDDVSDLLYTNGDFCYTIEAKENPSTIFPDTSFSSRSNELCLVQKPVIWVPNAFVVDGFNTTFRPVISFADFQNYHMLIYSRWGDVIFETSDIEQPWDGRMNGRLVQEGVYAYFVSIEDGNGRPYEARGTVVMLSNRDQ